MSNPKKGEPINPSARYALVVGLSQKDPLPGCDGCGPDSNDGGGGGGPGAHAGGRQFEVIQGGIGPYKWVGAKPFLTFADAKAWLGTQKATEFCKVYENVVVFESEIQTAYIDKNDCT